jgi:RNA polymerase sigma factor (sigma-70 family)
MITRSRIDNATLLALGRTGDSAALGALFERLRPAMYATALRMLGYGDDAHDVVQDAFLQVIAKLDTLEDPQAFPGWLKSIVERNCLMILRRKRNGPLDVVPHTEIQERFSELPETSCCGSSGLNHRVVAAFHDLPPTLQETAAIRYFTEHNSYEAIAETLAIPVGTVRSRLAEVRNKLKTKLMSAEVPEELRKADTAYAWEEFLWETWDNCYEHPAALDKYYNHFERDLSIVFTSGKQLSGRERMLQEFYEDISLGIKVTNQSIISTGKITIVESTLTNPPDRPGHCPPAAAMIHYHNGDRSTWQIRHHHAPRTCAGPFGYEEDRCKAC